MRMVNSGFSPKKRAGEMVESIRDDGRRGLSVAIAHEDVPLPGLKYLHLVQKPDETSESSATLPPNPGEAPGHLTPLGSPGRLQSSKAEDARLSSAALRLHLASLVEVGGGSVEP